MHSPEPVTDLGIKANDFKKGVSEKVDLKQKSRCAGASAQ
jgi:hypothetical protein